MKLKPDLLLSRKASRLQRLASFLLQCSLFSIASLSLLAVVFIIFFIAKDALPFFKLRGITEFFTSTNWYPTRNPAEFGALSIFVGSGLVTLGAVFVAVPIGIMAAICLSDILPFSIRQLVKPIIEILAAIPSVAYGFFALVIFTPFLQQNGGSMLAFGTWLIGLPLGAILIIVLVEKYIHFFYKYQGFIKVTLYVFLGILLLKGLADASGWFGRLVIESGTNAFNVSIILGIMALPTVVSVSEDALQSVGREMREASYALGATRTETIFFSVIPAAANGIIAAVILGVMRAVGETMVVWMASGNAAQIPHPWYNFLQPIRTLTATIAGDMGEADQVTGSGRYHVLFAMALCLLLISFFSNLFSEYILTRFQKKLGKK